MKKRKVVLVGTGFVGMSMAYAMLNTGGVTDLVLIDIDEQKAIGEEMDLSHGLSFAPQKIKVRAGNYSDCSDAAIVVITAGANQKEGQTRLELAEINARIIKGITENVMASGFEGIFVVASNPVDLMTYVVSKVSKLPSQKVIGSGTILDTARLRFLLSEKFNISTKNIHAYILGEHGDSSFVSWENAYVGCKKILEVMDDEHITREEMETIHKSVVNAAYEIINRKKATYYGIGMALNRLIKSILNDENSIMTVSTYLEGKYGQEDTFIGIPAVVGREGVREVLELKLTEEEQAKLDKSCGIMKNMIDEKIKNVIEGK